MTFKTWADVIAWAKKSTRPNGDCQGFAANDFIPAAGGSFKVGYGSANAAMAASKAAGTFHTGPPPSGRVVWVFYAFPTYGHVMLCYNGTALGDTSQATSKINAKKTVGTMPYNKYSYKYLGYSTTNGANTIPLIPAPVVVAKPTATQRQVISTSAAKVHTDATTAAAVTSSSPIKAGAIENVAGWKHGLKVTVGKVTSDVWFKIGSGWSAAACFTSQAITSLTDLNPVVVTPPVVTPPPATTPPSEPTEPSAPTTDPTEPSTPVTTQPDEPPATSEPTDPATPVDSTPSDPVSSTPTTPEPVLSWWQWLINLIASVFKSPTK